MEEKPKSPEELNPPPEFNKVINDFISDILITFPEYSGIIAKWWNRDSSSEESLSKETLFVFRHCVKVFPERFFDILYKNCDMFSQESEVNTEFLPGIVFKQLWNCDISDNTRDTIWKYLQLILFSVIGTVHNSSDLGDTAKLFESINEDELKSKLQETLENMQNMFEQKREEAQDGEGQQGEGEQTNTPFPSMPNAEQLHEHINSMMGGKLGKLAMELAEETAEDLNLDLEGEGDPKDVFQKLFKNPGKMMNMVKNIGSKIDEKIKSGEIKESELMKEGMDLLSKMKDMPGMDNMQKMFTQMGIPGLGKGAKINMPAMEAQLNRNMKTAKMKERMRAKAEANAKLKEQQHVISTNQQPTISEEEILKIFSTGEVVEKTPRGAKPPEANKNNKKKKGKK
jgi:hypothetical protein